MWTAYPQVLSQVAVVDLNEGLFSQDGAGSPLAAGVLRLRAPLEYQNQQRSFPVSISVIVCVK